MVYLFFLLAIIFGGSSSVWGICHPEKLDNLVSDYLENNPSRQIAIKPDLTQRFQEKRYSLIDPSNPKFKLEASLDEGMDEKMRINFTIQTKLSDGSRSSVLRGKEGFNKSLKYFEVRYSGIEANWNGTGDLKDNLDQFNKILNENPLMSLEDAASKTWTGKMALENGCSQIEVFGLQGKRGEYTMASANFDFPEDRITYQKNLKPVINAEVTPEGKRTFSAYPSQNRSLFAQAQVKDDNKTLSLEIIDRLPDGSTLDHFKSSEQFDHILDFFDGQFTKIEIKFSPANVFEKKRLKGIAGDPTTTLKDSEIAKLAASKGFTVVENASPISDGIVTLTLKKP